MATKRIPFREMYIDQATLFRPEGALVMAGNCFPVNDVYVPLPDLIAYSNSLSATCQGISSVFSGGTAYTFAGDNDSLYVTTSLTWSVAATGFATATADTWEFAEFDGKMLATNWTDAVQAKTIGGTTCFSAAFTSTLKPKAKHISTLRDFVILGYTNDATDGTVPNRVWWSGVADFTDFDPAASTQCDYQNLVQGGAVQRIIGGTEQALIIQEKQIQRMTYVGSPLVFDFDAIDAQRGTILPNSVVNWGRYVFFWSEDGAMLNTGGESIPIGQGMVDRYFWNNVDPTYAQNISAAVDPLNKIVVWFYPSTAATNGVPDKSLIYNWVDKRWTTTSYSIVQRMFLRLRNNAAPELAAITTSKSIARFNGKPNITTIVTGDIELAPGRRSTITGVRPVYYGIAAGNLGTDGSAKVQVRSREPRVAGTVTTGAALNSEGVSVLRSTGRYHRIDVSFSSTSTASGVSSILGVDVTYEADGER